MASSSATPGASAKENFKQRPKEVCDALFNSVTNIGEKLKDNDAKAKEALKAAVDGLNNARNMDWAGFCENQENATRLQTMETAAVGIEKTAGKLDTLLDDATADKKNDITTKASLIKSNTLTLVKQVELAGLQRRIKLKELDNNDGLVSYTSDAAGNEEDSSWGDVRYKEEIKKANIDDRSHGDRFDHGRDDREDGPAL